MSLGLCYPGFLVSFPSDSLRVKFVFVAIVFVAIFNFVLFVLFR